MGNKMLCSYCGKEIEKSFFMRFCPYCDNLLLIDTGKSPWHPLVAVISSIIFTPLAGALVTNINLRKLGKRLKADIVLIFTVLSSITLAFLFPKLPNNVVQVLNLSFYALLPLLFWLAQKNDFEKWKRSDSHNIASKWQKSLILSFAGLLIYLFIFLVVFSVLNSFSSRIYLVRILYLMGIFLLMVTFWHIINKIRRALSDK